MHVTVLGAGIVGLATAWELSRAGHAVTVIDRAAPGRGASAGNGAQLSYSYVAPLADASIWAQLPHLVLSPASPLKLRPQLDPQQWRWALAFLAACNARTAATTTARLLGLAARSRAGFEAMRSEIDPACDFTASGKLVLYRSAASVSAASRQVDLQREMGAVQRMVTPEECVAIEPALRGYHREIAGAVHTPSECAADCLKVCEALEVALRARGVAFVLGADIETFDLKAGRVHAVQTAGGAVQADAFVMSLGSASPRFGRQLGAYLPVYPLKGYSITLDVDPSPGAAPTVSVTDSARKTVFARLGKRLRVAGMAELVGHDGRIPEGRIDALVAATRAVFPRCSDFVERTPWTGMRPATPTGVPIIGRVEGAPANVLFNTGHGALGFTLAFGSAQELNEAIAAIL
ncbi:D-amino acid dehydrogenase [Variovorax sp. PAMC 28711]|uniref:D-amino acid dehydrogenase n=1 Tax=Variovorax sp. PAMC 28711 TaxID=1795631 RepID=UPI00078DD8CA|nr:D-amino acid dehydrogenase [Variovorax sp. PAMC 28711]AMM24682.1 amino acid dehydrogenase [Variovorax sp. PAMC 28711]